MKRISHILLASFAAVLPAAAQVSVSQPDSTEASGVVELTTAVEELTEEEMDAADQNRTRLTYEILAEDQRRSEAERTVAVLPMGSRLSRLDMESPFIYHCPWSLGAPSMMALHEGLNVEVGFSVSASNRMKGAGLGEHIAAAYALPFGKDRRWMGAFGIYADRLDWGGYNRTEAGFSGVLGYRVNDWCNLYVYGSYNFVPGRDNGYSPYAYNYASAYGPYGYGYHPYGFGGYGYSPFGYYDPYGYCDPYGYGAYANLRGRIGAAAEFKIGDSGHFTISVEHTVYDNGSRWPVALPPAPEVNNKPFAIGDGANSASRRYNRR